MTNGDGKNRLTLRFTDDLRAAIEAYGAQHGMGLAHTVRFICDRFLRDADAQPLGQLSAVRSAEVQEFLFSAMGHLLIKIIPEERTAILRETEGNIEGYHRQKPAKATRHGSA